MQERTNTRQIFITEFDLHRLDVLIENAGSTQSRDSRNLEELGEELLLADVVDPAGIPPDVITMNSRVCLQDMDTGEDLVYTLVFPKDANLESGRISVLAPVGTAMIGYREGDTITWPVPGGMKRLKVKKILYQPEAAGDYHL
ncbi:nucleoside diphosphate kinase regulator [Geomobilimonas luticola]|uniref:Nucleoside diphosphate kinase regulator n=1 Tax=Geomobilimonas luticola TaxID=1114878 RepID=A0ABS5SCF7_9BACT|nr:nucleoside diphosphate kinase regulator [Geomobilimonas luticola]MBT0653051.1 nucleoside diphosphate kinase regulator [Geomobilimonas luticola]